MLATYLDQAMELAKYEIIPEDGIYWGEIEGNARKSRKRFRNISQIRSNFGV